MIDHIPDRWNTPYLKFRRGGIALTRHKFHLSYNEMGDLKTWRPGVVVILSPRFAVVYLRVKRVTVGTKGCSRRFPGKRWGVAEKTW